jgi:hypothetical protein
MKNKKLLLIVSVIVALLGFGCASQDTSHYQAEAEAIASKSEAIKRQAVLELGNEVLEMTEKSTSGSGYRRDLIEIDTEYEAHRFVMKYHSALVQFYTKKFLNHYDSSTMSASFANERTRPKMLAIRENLKDAISTVCAMSIIHELEIHRKKAGRSVKP